MNTGNLCGTQKCGKQTDVLLLGIGRIFLSFYGKTADFVISSVKGACKNLIQIRTGSTFRTDWIPDTCISQVKISVQCNILTSIVFAVVNTGCKCSKLRNGFDEKGIRLTAGSAFKESGIHTACKRLIDGSFDGFAA